MAKHKKKNKTIKTIKTIESDKTDETNKIVEQAVNAVQFTMSTSPAISVIIPLYNAERYLGECLDSILAQTFQNFELIIVDDCSTDSSCEIVESYVPKFLCSPEGISNRD